MFDIVAGLGVDLGVGGFFFGVSGSYPGAAREPLRETSNVIDDGCWKQVWAEMTDSELEDRLFAYLWLSLHTPNTHAARVAQLIEEAERRGQPGMVERAA